MISWKFQKDRNAAWDCEQKIEWETEVGKEEEGGEEEGGGEGLEAGGLRQLRRRVIASSMCWLWVLLFLGGASGYKILALSPLCSKSHVIAYAPLLNELTARGHQVTAVVPYNVPSLSNGVQVLTDDSLKELAWGIFQYQFSETLGTTWNAISDELGFFEVSIQTCPKLLETPTVARLMQTVERGS
ncbi:unnamed protein product [Notodromas monacha]|uniref:Uncharacterized protein n=1 Tax=Notodromas monacha TaxID=399045 RepID=A0A7R9GHI4_9CRUS|nr:unnamed protein product [Notodromas monacha]CAG0921375.1 unnamed protein product [Notodromas monacha]